jgi:hypothetical protein
MNTLQLPAIDVSDPVVYFDEKSCQAYSALIYRIIADASDRGEEIGTSEIKAALGENLSQRYSLLDVLSHTKAIDSRQKGSRQVYFIQERYVKGVNTKHWTRKRRRND